MNFVHHDLGHQSRGTVVEVTLSGSAANVRLLDSSNFHSYRSGRRHRYYGGHVTRSPVRLDIPRDGHWHVAVDMGGYPGQVRASVRVLPGLLPPLRQVSRSPIAPLLQAHESEYERETLTDDETPVARDFDVFVSHATEDKDSVVRPLAHALVQHDLRVWYDEFELRIGDSLRRKIDAGLARSRFGIVVLSHAFFSKNWPQYELDGLVTLEMTGKQVILPLWHNISKNEVMANSPSLADKVARSTADFTIDEIAQEIADVIKGR